MLLSDGMRVLFVMQVVLERKLCEDVRKAFSGTREVEDAQPRPNSRKELCVCEYLSRMPLRAPSELLAKVNSGSVTPRRRRPRAAGRGANGGGSVFG
jgi:hypothetical protein